MSDDPAVQLDSPYGGEGAPYSPARQLLQRPGTVVAAAVVTWTAVFVTSFATIGLLYMVLQFGDAVLDWFDDGDTLRWYLIGAAVAVVAWCCVAAWLAGLVMRGRNWARIALVGSAVLVVAVSAMLIGAGWSLVPLLAGVAVIVLLFTGGANEWFGAGQSRTRTPGLRHNHRHA